MKISDFFTLFVNPEDEGDCLAKRLSQVPEIRVLRELIFTGLSEISVEDLLPHPILYHSSKNCFPNRVGMNPHWENRQICPPRQK